MAESLCVPIASSDYQSLKLRIQELEAIVAELTRDDEEKARIIADLTKQIEELKAKLAKYENPHTPSSAQRYKKKSKIINGLGNRYTCVLYPGMVPTNSLSEQVLMQKIIGTFRSENGAE